MIPTAPHHCPLFDSCSAPICPLDTDAVSRTMLRDERVCHYIYKAMDEPENTEHIVQLARELLASNRLPAELKRRVKRRS